MGQQNIREERARTDTIKRFEEHRKIMEEIEQRRIKEAEELKAAIDAGECSLFRIFYFDNNDRWEQCRAVARDVNDVIDFIKQEYINPEHLDEIEETEYGIEWMDCDPDLCRELSDEENPCESCISAEVAGFYIEEVDDPTVDELSYKTIFGTNDFYVLYKNDDGSISAKKADDWSPMTVMAMRLSELFRGK